MDRAATSWPGWARVCHLLLQHLLLLQAAPTLPPQGPAMLASHHLFLASHHLQLDHHHLIGHHLQILSRQGRYLPGPQSLHSHPLLPLHQRDLQLRQIMSPHCFLLLRFHPHRPPCPVATPLMLGLLLQGTGPTLRTRAAAPPESRNLSSPLRLTQGSQRTQSPFLNLLDMGGPSPTATWLLREKMRCWHKLWVLTRWVSESCPPWKRLKDQFSTQSIKPAITLSCSWTAYPLQQALKMRTRSLLRKERRHSTGQIIRVPCLDP